MVVIILYIQVHKETNQNQDWCNYSCHNSNGLFHRYLIEVDRYSIQTLQDDGTREVRIHGCEYRVSEEVLLELLGCFGEVLTDITEELLLLWQIFPKLTNHNDIPPDAWCSEAPINLIQEPMELTWQNSSSNQKEKRKNFIKTNTFPLFTRHRVACRPFNIPSMYSLVLWSNFSKKTRLI